MPLSFLRDEHLRGRLWRAIRRQNARGGLHIDAEQVGDPQDLPRRSADPDILLWAEREGRFLLSRDVRTMPGHFAAHLQSGRHSPGLIFLARGPSLSAIISELELIAYAGAAADYYDQIRFAP